MASTENSASDSRAADSRADKFARFADLTYDDFRRLARDDSLSRYEKIGFPDEYRRGFETRIFKDIRAKLNLLDGRDKKVADIGPGCSELPLMMASLCARRGHRLTWVDSAEMLAQLPDFPFVARIPARFPLDCASFIEQHAGSFHAVLAYSVLHYVMPGSDIFDFVDAAARLLAPSGALLIGDVPNISMRKRFFASESGRRFHRAFTGQQTDPGVCFNAPEPGRIDDAVMMALVMRQRAAGLHAYIVPQNGRLPMANRREDLLILRP